MGFHSGNTVQAALYLLPSSRRQKGGNESSGRKQKQQRKANGPRRVLIFGRLFELALYRAEVLRSRGFTVITPKTKSEAVAAIEDGEFDALVISYTLPSETAEEIVEILRQKCPDCPLITISETGSADRKLDPDRVVRASDGPPGLIKALQQVFRIQ